MSAGLLLALSVIAQVNGSNISSVKVLSCIC